jgi:hypothetical protein
LDRSDETAVAINPKNCTTLLQGRPVSMEHNLSTLLTSPKTVA